MNYKPSFLIKISQKKFSKNKMTFLFSSSTSLSNKFISNYLFQVTHLFDELLCTLTIIVHGSVFFSVIAVNSSFYYELPSISSILLTILIHNISIKIQCIRQFLHYFHTIWNLFFHYSNSKKGWYYFLTFDMEFNAWSIVLVSSLIS